MHYFPKELFVEKGFTAEFIFKKVETPCGLLYHVSVKDQSDNAFFFTMKQNKKGKFRIVDAPKVPGWIIDREKALQKVIDGNRN